MQPTSITLDAQDIQSLNDFIQEIPTKYGVSLINFLNQAVRKNEASQAKPAEPAAEVAAE